MSPSNLLLDTCVILFALEGATLRAEAVTKIREAGKADSLFVSPASAWEVGGRQQTPTPHRTAGLF
jgi:PIN domain nuclease of toxin-antitoxin system